jgi:hypothetical protein
MIPRLVNTLWRAASARQARRFRRSTERLAETQAAMLAGCLAANRDSEIGRRHGFGSISSPAEYQRRVPLSVYDDYAADIARLAAGETRILTCQAVERFELSSGSTAACKLIPYTAALRQEFRRGLAAWIADLYRHDPELLDGPAYWSITPLTAGPERTPGGVPIGFAEDSDYLGPLGALVESTLAVPNAVKHLRDVAAFRYATLLFLLRQPRLRLISVWNPTFLTLLLAPLETWWDRLLSDLARGTFEPPGAPGTIDPAVRRRLERHLAPAPRRARGLARLHPGQVSAMAAMSQVWATPAMAAMPAMAATAAMAAIWPRLRLISCWADGPAAPYARELARRFPGVTVQPKGLLATEAFVSLPLAGRDGAALAATAHFFEFLTGSGEPRLAHQLERGQTYGVVVTTGGGFYRYQLHDLVEVVGFLGQVPCLRFAGKTDQVSDWFGEKLHESFVAGVLERLFARHRLQPSFALVAPERSAGELLRYALYVELPDARSLPGSSGLPVSSDFPGASDRPGFPDLAALARELDGALCENFHYAYCRRLGQLAPPRVTTVEGGQERYLRACQNQGQKLGNVKPAALQKAIHWGEWLGAPA